MALPRGQLDRKIVDLLSGKGTGASLAAIASEPPPAQESAGMFGPTRSMDWRSRAAEIMRRQMIDRSNQEEQPEWFRQRG